MLLFLIPAHAGVIPQAYVPPDADRSYPRARGGDPILVGSTVFVGDLSPRTRG